MKSLAAKPGDLGSAPKNQEVEERTSVTKLSSDLQKQAMTHMPAPPPQLHTKINICNLEN